VQSHQYALLGEKIAKNVGYHCWPSFSQSSQIIALQLRRDIDRDEKNNYINGLALKFLRDMKMSFLNVNATFEIGLIPRL